MKNKMALAALGLGAAYLMRNKESRAKVSEQFKNFGSSPSRFEKQKDSNAHSTAGNTRNKGILGGIFG